jgi:RimJ/RimL family protein N-acetyltransferase
MVEIIMLQDDGTQLERFWRLRLRALQDAPEAFSSSYEETVQTPLPDLVEQQRARISTENVVFLAQEDSEFVGITGLYRETRLKTKHKGHIWGVYVLPEWRGRGIARVLMQRAIAYARGWAGLQLLHLSVTAGNTAALRLYESLGFVTWGTQPKALYVDGVYFDEHHMALHL